MINCRQLTALSGRLAAFVLLLATAGCSVLPEPKPVQLLDPQLATPAALPAPANWSLNINRPVADPLRDSNRVLIRTRQGQLQVHPSARWVAASPDLLRTLLVRYLRDSRALPQTGSAAVGLDRTLDIDLRQFELVEDSNRLLAKISVEARLYHNRSAKLLARQLFTRQQPVSGIQPAPLVSGFEAGLQQIIPEISDWLLAYDAPLDPPGSKPRQ